MVTKIYVRRILGAALAAVLMCFGILGLVSSLNEVSVTSAASNTVVNVIIEDRVSPSIDSITPVSGPITGGTLITIRGGNLENIVSVIVGGQECLDITVLNPTVVQCTVKPHAAGLVDVTVTTIEGFSYTKRNAFTYITDAVPPIPLPPITGMMSLGRFGAMTNYDIFFAVGSLLIIGFIVFLMIRRSRKSREENRFIVNKKT